VRSIHRRVCAACTRVESRDRRAIDGRDQAKLSNV
jgi:hypothetical protein